MTHNTSISVDDFTCEPLDEAKHATGLFTCGDLQMDKWFRDRALSYVEESLAKVHVLRRAENDDGTVVGFFTLSATELQTQRIPKKSRFVSYHNSNITSNISKHPALLLGKFAVNDSYQRLGISSLLMLEVYKNFYHVGESIGAKFLLVELREEEDKKNLSNYYRNEFGFFELADTSGQLTGLAKKVDNIAADLRALDLI